MDEYKQYIDENEVFHVQTKVNFSLCNPTKKLSINDLLKMTSDIAVEHYNRIGLSRDYLLEQGFAILVSRCSFKIHRMPIENEPITIDTWENKPEALQLFRSYEIKDKDGNILVSGLSSWLLVDPVKRSIMPTKKFTLRQLPQTAKEPDCMKPSKISEPENLEVLGERTIRYSDLDANGHTNNSRYAAFIMDALPAEYQSKTIKDFKINYSKEAFLGKELTIKAGFNKTDTDNEQSDVVTIIAEHDEGKCFEAELYY